MKSYTDIPQSEVLTKILPRESADMFIDCTNPYYIHTELRHVEHFDSEHYPCWSLAALLDVLPFHLIANNRSYTFSMVKGLNKDGETYAIKYAIFNTTFYLHLTDFYNNPVDACYEMILKLKEKNLL